MRFPDGQPATRTFRDWWADTNDMIIASSIVLAGVVFVALPIFV